MKKIFQVSVICAPTIHIDELDQDDKMDEPWGVHIYDVVAKDQAKAEEGALDQFHNAIAIRCLDDFEISTVAVELNQIQESEKK